MKTSGLPALLAGVLAVGAKAAAPRTTVALDLGCV